VATGVLSNTNPSHWRTLRQEYPAFRPLFAGHPRYVQPSHLLGVRKPDPAVLPGLPRAHGPRAVRARILDDLAENVEAARQQGWSAFRIDASGDTVAQMRDVLARLG
jgi:putative hydrolase of the HAD superfamily